MINENELPKSWELKNLGEVCQFEYGKGLTKKDRDKDGIYNVYGSNGVVGKHSEYLIDEPCIIVGRKGAAGEVHLSLRSSWAIDTTYFVKKPKHFDLKFLYFQLKNLNLQSLDKSTAIPGLNRNDAYAKKVVLPPLAEQERIVAKIEELFSELDAGLENLKTAQAQLKIYRQAVLKYAFEGKLTNDNINEDDLPVGWKWVNIDFFFTDKKNGMRTGPFGTTLKKSEHQSDGVAVLGIENIGEGVFQMPNKIFVTKKKAEELKSFQVNSNDIIISRSGTVGEICLVPDSMKNSIISTNLIKVVLNQKLINPKFFVYMFQGGMVRQQVFNLCKGSSRAFLNQTILSTLDFPYCSIEEQQRIVEEIESRLSVCDKLEETINASLKQAEALRQSILKQAFEGKLIKPKEIEKPKRTPFYQMQTLGLIVDRSKQKNIRHGEMTLAKYAFLADKIYDVPIYDKYERWHLGPYPTAIKKTVNNREYFKIENNTIRVLNEEKLFKYKNDYQEQIEIAVDELAEIFSSFEPQERSHKTELLATVCKVIEDIQTTEIKAVRQSMAEWRIDLKDKRFGNKAEKFGEDETAKCVKFVIKKGWDKKLIDSN